MSFLNSVLSSIATGSPVVVQDARSARSTSPVKQLSSTKIVNTADRPANGLSKRKAETDIQAGPTKILKRGPYASPVTQNVSQKQSSSMDRVVSAPRGDRILPAPNNGFRKRPDEDAAPVSATGPRAASAASTPNAAGASATITAAPPAKKGSYREIMARAQALKLQQADFMQIKHKPETKLTKRQKQAQELESARAVKEPGTKKVPVGASKTATSTTATATAKGTQEKKRKPVDLGYSGTMRAQPVSARPKRPDVAARPTTQSSGRDGDRPRPGGGRYTYANYSDDEQGDEDDEYDSESDMEAGGLDELEREEQESLRVAKAEDARALREEQEHDRLKRERKRKLAQLAASRR